MNRRNLVLAAPALLAGGVVSGLPGLAWAAPSAAATTLKFGQSADVSGDGASHGRDVRAGIQAAFDAANRGEGASRGPRFELVTLDDAGSAERCAENVRTFAASGVSALIGLTHGGGAEAAMGDIERHQMALLGAATGDMGLRNENFSSAYNTRAGYDLEFKSMVTYAKTRELSRVGIVYLEGTAKPNLAAMTVALASAGLLPVETIALDRNAPSFDAVAARLVAAKLDCVLFMAHATPTAAIIDRMVAARYHGLFYASSMAGQPLAATLASRGQSAIMSSVVPRSSALGLGVVTRCKQDLAALGSNVTMNASVLEGYIGGRTAVEAVRGIYRGAPVNRAQLKESLATLRTDLGGYKVHFTPGNPNGSKFVELLTLNRYGNLVG
jgi:branched-chain amino acid transport system substrate-binding protein